MPTAATIWMFVATVFFADGSQAEWPASFNDQASCEEFRGSLPEWFDEHAESLGIIGAQWETACREVVDPYPLDHQSDQHSH